MTVNHSIHIQAAVAGAWRSLGNDLAPIAEKGRLGDLIGTLVGHASTVRTADETVPVALWRLREHATLLHEGGPAQTLYVLRSGSLKCIHTQEDGYEQVLSVALPGDLLGFEALHSGRQPVGVVALEDVTVYALPLNGLRALRQQCPALDHAMQLTLSRQLIRAASTAEMIAAVASDVRLARFLLWMSTRMAELGRSPLRMVLRLSRRDIASLLGVAHETVSRSFTTLADAGHVTVDNREVEILDLAGLRQRALSTRKQLDDAVRPSLGSMVRPSLASAPTMSWLPGTAARPAAVA